MFVRAVGIPGVDTRGQAPDGKHGGPRPRVFSTPNALAIGMRSSDMAYTRLGETGLEVSEFCLGCMNFGSDEPWMIGDEERSREVIDRALDLGINFLDTANVYSQGESEEIVGRAIEGRRDELVIATKVYGRMREGPNGQGLSRRHVLEQAERSLERLGTDYIDLYQIHRWDENTPIEETLSALDHLVNEGKVRYIGASTMQIGRAHV